jgi:hypothetical protein
MVEEKTYNIKVPIELWNDFKSTIPRKITINKMLNELIKKYVSGELKIPKYNETRIIQQIASIEQKMKEMDADLKVLKSSGMSPFRSKSVFPSSIEEEIPVKEGIHLQPTKDEDGNIIFKKTKPLKYGSD